LISTGGLLLVAWFAGGTTGAPGPAPAAVPIAAVPAASTQTPDAESPVAVSTRISPNPCSIGDVLELEVVAAYPRGITVNLPIGLDFEPLHLVGIEESDPEPTGEELRKTFRVKLQYFDVGEAQVPSFPLTYVTAQGEVQTFTVPARVFEVEPLLANEADPQRQGEDPPISIEYPNFLAETAIYAALVTLLLALLGWVLVRRYLGRHKPAPVIPVIPPHDRAREDLHGLAQEDLPAQERWQEYYLRLTEIARAYVEGRFGIECLDRTTDELRLALLRAEAQIAPINPTELVHFLQRADLVKFARAIASDKEAQSSMTFVHDMVDQTTRADGAAAGGGKSPPDSEAEPPQDSPPDSSAGPPTQEVA
jgi:hypothetical protein